MLVSKVFNFPLIKEDEGYGIVSLSCPKGHVITTDNATKEDFARMEAHRKIEQRREMEELERSFDLNYY